MPAITSPPVTPASMAKVSHVRQRERNSARKRIRTAATSASYSSDGRRRDRGAHDAAVLHPHNAFSSVGNALVVRDQQDRLPARVESAEELEHLEPASAEVSSSRLKNWNTKPTCRRRRWASSLSSLPANDSPARKTSPSLGASSPATRFSNVDLPHPDGPVTAMNSPAATIRSIPRNALTGAPSDSNVLRRRTVFNTSGAADTTRP